MKDPIANMNDSTVTIMPTIHAQPFPLAKPQPTTSQMRLKNRTTPPIMTPIPPSADPKVPVLATTADKANIARLPSTPTIPISIASIAIRVTPNGRDSLTGCMRLGLHVANVKPSVTRAETTNDYYSIRWSRTKSREGWIRSEGAPQDGLFVEPVGTLAPQLEHLSALPLSKWTLSDWSFKHWELCQVHPSTDPSRRRPSHEAA